MRDIKAVWWKNATFYQIWPASYKDSNEDGMGDLQGVISTLDYIKGLGADAIWLCPMYDSPQHDMGYDISNYEDVWSKYGTLADMDCLIQQAHARGLRLILDLVVNHTSDEHEWFRESRKSRDNKYSDWYIWRDPKYANGIRRPPTNWRAAFGGSAWQYVPERDQYFLHLFAPQQPDLNWENAATRQAIYASAIEFWLKRGIDGFRVDTVNLYSNNVNFPDASITDPAEVYQNAELLYIDGPRMHEWLREQRRDILDKYGDIFLVGELPSTKSDEVIKYISATQRELDCVFDFGICELGGRYGRPPHETWQHSLPELKAAIQKTQSLLDFPHTWATVFAENHDQPRNLSTLGTEGPKYRIKSTQLLAILFATLSGTLFVYQGQEIGMMNVPRGEGSKYFQDVCSLNYLKDIQQRYPSDESMLQKAQDALCRVGRDNARTPMQWTERPNADFTAEDATPWMPVNENYTKINMVHEQDDSNGILAMWKRMLKIRKEYADVFIHGHFEIHDFDNPLTFTFTKKARDYQAYVMLNFSTEEQDIVIPDTVEGLKLGSLVSNETDPGERLGPWEARVYIGERLS
ncbi:glucan 1,6-alpha-glucosidase [Exophiala viscosa]|uniref:glucan 1,6-alpha-glucosidase n=1 Tax=Exophiala viscosa TaxID=2486360 RepID=UPI0021A1C9F7|nr:glucan 1,6-alpha-glucosidase [Exophiala viscosa]